MRSYGESKAKIVDGWNFWAGMFRKRTTLACELAMFRRRRRSREWKLMRARIPEFAKLKVEGADSGTGSADQRLMEVGSKEGH
jgi:hypothetical protein